MPQYGCAWDTFERWLRLPEIAFLAEPDGVDEHLRRFSQTLAFSPALWTDAYLAAFALAGGQRLGAFDVDFNRFSRLKFLHLSV